MSWVADPSIAWRVVLGAEVAHPPDAARLRDSLRRLYATQGWVGDGLVVGDPDPAALRRRLGALREPVVALGLAGRHVVVSVDHAAVDGLGALAVLAAVLDTPVTSAARGVGERPDASGFARTVVRRLGEVAVSPPARVRGTGGTPGTGDDTYVATDVVGSPRTADLVAAAVRALATTGARRRVAVAVGVARSVEQETIADRSALLRLRDAERLSRDDVAALLREAPTQAPPTGSGAGGGVVRLGLRLLAPRLGSTVLVSHLGDVTAPDVTSLAFHPVTAGGSGLSLGAVTLRGTTTLTLRARGRDWGTAELGRLLAAVAAELG